MEEAIGIIDNRALAERGYWPATASELFAAGKYSKAVDLCRRKLESEGNIVSGRVILARSLFHAGQYAEAKEQFLRVLKLDAANLVALKYLGDILYRDREEAAAMTYYRRIFEIDPHCEGLSCPIENPGKVEIRQLTVKRAGETAPEVESIRLREPAFITETVGDIYREQGYLQLARDVYRRLLTAGESGRIAEKLSEIEEKLNKKEGTHEGTH